MSQPRRYNLVASIYLNSRGFAFTIFEGALAPLDWGVVEVRGKEKRQRLLLRAGALISRYVPDVLVLQDTSHNGTQRTHRIRHLNEAIAESAEGYCIPVLSYSRADVYRCFEYLGAVSKDRIAAEISKNIPALERFLPPRRKAWMNEHPRMGIFDAAALVLTFFYTQGGRQ
jgi:hypothetical protein